MVADEKVFVAGREGLIYALSPQTGAEIWRADVGSPVLTTPAYADGRLYVGPGDMHVYALDGKTGGRIWKSETIPAAAMREYWLVASHGVVITSVQLAYACHPMAQVPCRTGLDLSPFPRRRTLVCFVSSGCWRRTG